MVYIINSALTGSSSITVISFVFFSFFFPYNISKCLINKLYLIEYKANPLMVRNMYCTPCQRFCFYFRCSPKGLGFEVIYKDKYYPILGSDHRVYNKVPGTIMSH